MCVLGGGAAALEDETEEMNRSDRDNEVVSRCELVLLSDADDLIVCFGGWVMEHSVHVTKLLNMCAMSIWIHFGPISGSPYEPGQASAWRYEWFCRWITWGRSNLTHVWGVSRARGRGLALGGREGPYHMERRWNFLPIARRGGQGDRSSWCCPDWPALKGLLGSSLIKAASL